MTGVSASVDDHEVLSALRLLQSRIGNIRKPLGEIGQTLVTLTDLSFRHEQDPWGAAWKRLAASTLARRRKGRGTGSNKILRDTGVLQNSINYQATSDQVAIGTNVTYAAIHQFGGDIQREARTHTLYFRVNRSGQVGNRFVRRNRSNFAQDVTIGAHTIHIDARPFLPIRKDGTVDIPAGTINEMLDILSRHLRGNL